MKLLALGLAALSLSLAACAPGETSFCPNLEPLGSGVAAVDSSGRGLPGVQCTRQTCGEGLICAATCNGAGGCLLGGACTKECACDSDCASMGAGYRCSTRRVCVKTCTTDADCPVSMACLNGRTCGEIRCGGLETVGGPDLQQHRADCR